MDSRSATAVDHNLDLIPLSRAQYSMWLADNLPGGPNVNIAQYVDIEGEIDIDLLTEAVNIAGRETESLIARVVEIDGRPYQFVDRDITYADALLDLSDADDPYAAAMEWMRRDYSTRAVDLGRDRLAVGKFIKIGERRHLWYARAHHLIIDGYGAFNFIGRVTEHYNAAIESRQPARLVAASLREIAEAERAYHASPRFESDRAYWHEKISDLPTPVSLSGRAARWSDSDHMAGRQLPGRLSELLERFAEDQGASPAQVIIAAFAAFLARMTGSDEVVLSMPVSGRVTRRLRHAAAMLANMVPIRFAVTPQTTVGGLVGAAVSELVSAIRHQLYRFEDMRRETNIADTAANSFGPVVNILFFDSEIRLGSAVGRYRALTSGALDDMQLNLYRPGSDGPLLLELHGNPNLYGQDELELHTTRFVEFLRRLLETPLDTPVVSIPLVDAVEEQRIVGGLAGRDGVLADTTLVGLLTEQAAATPDAVAVTCGSTALTYRELDERSNRFARALIARGAGPETLVAVAMPRDADLLVATLAVLKSGAGYLPLDIAHPADRLDYVLADAAPVLVVTNSALRDSVPGDAARKVVFDDRAGSDGDSAPVTEAERSRPLRPDNIAYAIYTSGSTGRPKGVPIAHRAVASYLTNACAEIGVRPGDVWTLFHSFAFDYSVWEIFGPLVSGGRVVVMDTATTRSPDDVVRLVAREKVT
ncbi:AMP-binding protein, partial [Nocardia testacea]|uniref:AMP-binding protein n=1 Tax=Nocardia testacea TaxID=248551 RepID=UPI0005844AD8